MFHIYGQGLLSLDQFRRIENKMHPVVEAFGFLSFTASSTKGKNEMEHTFLKS